MEAVVVSPTRPAGRAAWRWLLGLAAPHRLRLGIAGASLATSTAVGLVVPWAVGQGIDAALVASSLESLRVLILALVGLLVVRGLSVFVEVYALRSAGALILQDLRTRLHARLLDLTPAFFESQRTGDLLSRLGSDVDTVAGALTDEIIHALDSLLSMLGALVILLALHTGLTLVMLLAVPPVIVVAVLFGLRLERLSRARQDAFAAAGIVAEESLSGIRTVQAFGREPQERARYGAAIAEATGLALRAARAWGAFSAVVGTVAMSAVALVIWYGATLIVAKQLTPGELTSFLIYTISVAASVGALTGLYANLKAAMGATHRVRELLATEPAVRDAPDALDPGAGSPGAGSPGAGSPGAGSSGAGSPGAGSPGSVRGHLALEEVSFSYASAPERKALDGVSLEARPGEVVALVGPSGAGKSTIVNLVLRFYDPQAGVVRLDGVDLRRLRLAGLRRAIGLVPQDIFLFGGTIAENIRYGRPGASDAEVAAAAEAAHAAGFIAKLPQGYASVVGERGVRLSAGERQRIAIARVFLEDPAVVVLDEATSALDAESEHLVTRALETLMQGRTTLVVAHRLATVMRAARVVLVDSGRIADQAPHAELIERNALYRRFCELQMLPARQD